LTTEQAHAFDAIGTVRGFHPILLHGVTGSGKTEIYMRAAEHFAAAGKSSLILVPEIGLTPQLTERFAQRFPGRIAILHSSLTRASASTSGCGFMPVTLRSSSGPGLQCLRRSRISASLLWMREHETSYKQEEMPRYHARDTAVMRAKFSGATVVLGSATPSMESFRNAESARYTRVSLRTRVEDRPLPDIEIVNMREEYAPKASRLSFHDAAAGRFSPAGTARTNDDSSKPARVCGFPVMPAMRVYLSVHFLQRGAHLSSKDR
jgi:primosomal protein N' (replication factor Y)